jgi:hypothetical protein
MSLPSCGTSILPARLARSWAEMVSCDGAEAGGASGLALADAVGGGGAGGDSGDGAPSPVGTGGAGTLAIRASHYQKNPAGVPLARPILVA